MAQRGIRGGHHAGIWRPQPLMHQVIPGRLEAIIGSLQLVLEFDDGGLDITDLARTLARGREEVGHLRKYPFARI